MENRSVQNPVPEPALTPTLAPISKPRFPVMYLVLSVFILLFLASTAFLYYQNIQLKKMLANYQTPVVSPTPSATADPTANWKTYTNTQYGFSLKYPEDWITTKDRVLQDQCQSIDVSKSDAIGLELGIKEYVSREALGNDLTLYESNLQNVAQSYQSYNDLTVNFPNISQKDIAVIGPQGEGELNEIFIKGPEGTGYYKITVWYAGPTSGPNTCVGKQNDYKQILSTFKFTQ